MVNLLCLAQKSALGNLPGAYYSATPRSASSAMSDDEGRNISVVNDQPDVSSFCGPVHLCTPKPEPDRLRKSTVLNSQGDQEQIGDHGASTRSLDAVAEISWHAARPELGIAPERLGMISV